MKALWEDADVALADGFEQQQERSIAAALCLLPPGPVSPETLERVLFPRIGRADARWRLNRWNDGGFVCLLRNVSGDCKVYVPPAKLADLHRTVFGPPRFAKGPVRGTAADPEVDLVNDMMTLAALIADERPVLTKKGALPKRTCDAWVKRLTLPEEAGERLAEGRRAMLPLPSRLAVVLDLLFRTGLAAFREGRLEADPSALLAWMATGDAALRRHAYFTWLQAFLPAHPFARHLAWRLSEVPEGRWLSVAAEASAWRECLAACRLDGGDGGDWFEALRPLQWAGWLAVGEAEDGTPALRPALPLQPPSGDAEAGGLAAAAVERPLHVQPDFELLLPSSRHYALHGVIAGFSEPVRIDRMNASRLTERAVKRAFGRGWTADAIVDVLARVSADDLPEEVVRGLKDWEKAERLFQAEPAVVLRFASEETAESFASIASLQSLLRADNRFGTAAYVLREEEWSAFCRTAARLGYGKPAFRSGVLGGGGALPGGHSPLAGKSARKGDGTADGRIGTGELAQTIESAKTGAMAETDELAEAGGVTDTGEMEETEGSAAMGEAVATAGESPNWDRSEADAARMTDFRLAAVQACLHQTASGHPQPVWKHEHKAPLPGLFPSPFGIDGYRSAGNWQQEDLFPGLGKASSHWWKERRGYHPATKRRILELALEWGCRVEAGCAGEVLVFLVTELAEEDGGVRIGGASERGGVSLNLDDLESLRLLLPGISKNNT